jgi:DNA-binding NarL/FixJ family response regulator
VRVSLLDGQLLRGDALARVLAESGYVVVGRHTRVDSFLSALAQEQPQIACVDVTLDDEDGVGALAEARQFHPNLQVLALGDGPGALDRCIGAGAAAYLDARNSNCDEVLPPGAAGLASRRLGPHAERRLSGTRAPSTRAPAARRASGRSWPACRWRDNGHRATCGSERTVKAASRALPEAAAGQPDAARPARPAPGSPPASQ